MEGLSLFGDLKEDKADQNILFNTGTFYDYMTGGAELGFNDRWYLNGGLGAFLNGIYGGGNMYKSTFMNSLLARMLAIYPWSEMFLLDTEGAQNASRINSFARELGVDVMDRITVRNSNGSTIIDVDYVYKFVQDIANRKMKYRDKAMVETPFINPATGKRIKVWVPTIIFIDSLTELESIWEEELLEKEGISSSKTKKVWMDDGNQKTLLVRKLRKLASEFGVIIVLSAHKGKNNDMGSSPMSKPKKQLQFMKQDDKIKGVGSRYEFLTHVLAEVASCTNYTMLDSKKEPLYKDGMTGSTDLNDLSVMIHRNKSQASGIMQNFVVSQSLGLLADITNYHFLRTNSYYGLNGLDRSKAANKQRHSLALHPEVAFSRNQIRSVIDADPKVRRAMEITANYAFVCQTWNQSQLPMMNGMCSDQLFDTLVDSNDGLVEEILNSRGYWTYAKDHPLQHMSIFDVMESISSGKIKKVS